MNVIEIKNLRKIYNEKTVPVNAVNDVSLSFKAKEFTAIVGASGSGKTTLLNLIGGIDTPTSGNVFINGKNVSELSENKMTQFRRDNIGFVFQQYNLLPVLTVKENTGAKNQHVFTLHADKLDGVCNADLLTNTLNQLECVEAIDINMETKTLLCFCQSNAEVEKLTGVVEGLVSI